MTVTLIEKVVEIKRVILFGFLVFASSHAIGQKHFLPLYAPNGNHQLRGWHFAPGITYMLPTRFNFTNKLSESPETATIATYDPGGKIGPYLGVGRFRLLNSMIFPQRIEYGLAYKRLTGFENATYRQLQADNNEILSEVEGRSDFKDNFLSAYFSMGQYLRLGEYTYLLNSLGVQGDWCFIPGRTAAGIVPGVTDQFPGTVFFQAFYRLGFGYKLESGWFLEPSLETPILSLFPFDRGRSTLPYFSTRYRPLIFTLRFYRQDLRKAADCVGTSSKPGSSQLWGKMKPAKKKMKKR